MFRRLTTLLLLLALLTACGGAGSGGQRAVALDGLWGGLMSYSGTDFAAFAMQVSTTVTGSSGSVSGAGLFVTTDGTRVPFTVRGSTQPTSISLTLIDYVNDSLVMTGNQSGQVFRGSWDFPALAVGGTFRMAFEDNVHLLEAPTSGEAPQSFRELFPVSF